MRILLTNDDGMDADGLAALVVATHKLRPNDELFVVAPKDNQSGSAASMGKVAHHVPIEWRSHTFVDCPDVPAFRLDAPPGGCVILACLRAFGEPPDFVLAGINYGANCGRSVLPSGTIGAVLTAANYGISGLAVSLDSPPGNSTMLWEIAAEMAVDYIDWLADQPTPATASLNLPNLSRNKIKGVQFAPPLAPLNMIVTELDSVDEKHIHTRIARAGDVSEQSDRGLLANGWAVLSPLIRPSVPEGVEPPEGVITRQ